MERVWTCYKDLEDNWIVNTNNNINRYVWGRSGRGGLGGFSASNPNYQVRYTSITSGEGGISDPDPELSVDGIYHNNSLRVIGKTYQYEVKKMNDDWVGVFQPDDEIAINFSVFGKPTIVNVDESSIKNNSFVFPNPFDNTLNISTNKLTGNNEQYLIEIIDILGNRVFSESIDSLSEQKIKSINTTLLHSGFYVLKILNNRNEIVQTYNLIKI